MTMRPALLSSKEELLCYKGLVPFVAPFLNSKSTAFGNGTIPLMLAMASVEHNTTALGVQVPSF